MFAGRDFDPGQVLARRENERRHNRNRTAIATELPLPWQQQALCQDLGLSIIVDAMSSDDPFLHDAAQVGVLSSLADIDPIKYRQEILADCLDNPEIVRAIYRVAIEAIEGERSNYWSAFGRYPTGILHHAVEVMHLFAGKLRSLRSIAEQYSSRFRSAGMSRFLAMLECELEETYLVEMEEHLSRLKFRRGILISARLGRGNKARDFVLRKLPDDTRSWILRHLFDERSEGYTFRLHPRDEAGARALAALSDRGVDLAANAVAQSADHLLGFFQMLRTELAFYVGCLNLRERLAELDEPICLPAPLPLGARMLSAAGLYDPSLALSMGQKVVGNDFQAERNDLVIITGANTGGKSTFLRSVGAAQLMMQAGMFVPAAKFSAELCAGVYTHYRREEDATMESGKWDEELERMSEIVDQITPDSMLLLNKSFASTNEREGSEIASQIVSALLDRRIKVLFVTHLYHFARSQFTQPVASASFLRAERRPDGTRPFRLVSGEPLQTSYGEDLYRAIFSGSNS